MTRGEVRALIRGYPLGVLTPLRDAGIEGKPWADPFLKQVYAGYSDAAIHFQFVDWLESTNDVLRRYNAGEREFTDEDRTLLEWRQLWDEEDARLKSKKRKLKKTYTGDELAAAEAALLEERSEAEKLARYVLRQKLGRPATRARRQPTED